MKILYLIILFVQNIHGNVSEVERIEFCNGLECDETENKTVCGLKKENGNNVFKLFDNECLLLKYGCQVDIDNAYGITNKERCKLQKNNEKYCPDCRLIEKELVCGIRKDGEGFRVRLFESECHLSQYNCEQKTQFTTTALLICGTENIRRAMPNKRPISDLETHVNINDKTDEEVDEEMGEIGKVTEETINNIDKHSDPTVVNQSINGIGRSEVPIEQNINDVSEVDEITKTGQTITKYGDHDKFKSTDQTINVIDETRTTEQVIGADELSETTTTDQTVNDVDELDEIKITEQHFNDSEFVEATNPTFYDIRESTISDPAFNGIVKNITNTDEIQKKNTTHKNIVVIHGSMADMLRINQTVENFFAATHVLDLPVKEVQPTTYENTRRRLIRIFGPVKVFTPWLKIPENITEDHHHKPTLSSCFHKCPTKCPDTYAPVCGVPGIVAREPSLMFKNHCFMDVAQCKMFWEDKSWTAESSAYIESSFLFCLGDELNGLYRFLPLIKTLQHMGRLKKKGRYHYKLTNMRFFNQLLSGQPNVMGR